MKNGCTEPENCPKESIVTKKPTLGTESIRSELELITEAETEPITETTTEQPTEALSTEPEGTEEVLPIERTESTTQPTTEPTTELILNRQPNPRQSLLLKLQLKRKQLCLSQSKLSQR